MIVTRSVSNVFALGTALVIALLTFAVLHVAVRANPGPLYVSAADPTCGGHSPCYTKIQSALDGASDFDEIRVASGLYPLTETLVITKNVRLLGGWDSNYTHRTVASSVVNAYNNGTVMVISNMSTTTVDGFTISAGFQATDEGGGIRIVGGSSPTIRHNLITHNVVSYTAGSNYGFGAGIYVQDSSPIIEDNDIISNTARGGSSGAGGGGGIYSQNSDTIIRGNRIVNNMVEGYAGGGLYLYSGGSAVVSGNLIEANVVQGYYGGGIADRQPSNNRYENNVIVDNSAPFGGGFYDYNTSATIVNNTIVGNNRQGGGEGIAIDSSYPVTLTNNLVVTHTYGIFSRGTVSPTLWNNDVWGSSTANYHGVVTGTTDISADPLLSGITPGDVHLLSGSPCIDAGATVSLTTDFYGDPRPVGSGYDIGADEYALHVYLPIVEKNYSP